MPAKAHQESPSSGPEATSRPQSVASDAGQLPTVQGMDAAMATAQIMSQGMMDLMTQRGESLRQAQGEMTNLITQAVGSAANPFAMMVLPLRCAEIGIRHWMSDAQQSVRHSQDIVTRAMSVSFGPRDGR